jgi:hypothetical protein
LWTDNGQAGDEPLKRGGSVHREVFAGGGDVDAARRVVPEPDDDGEGGLISLRRPVEVDALPGRRPEGLAADAAPEVAQPVAGSGYQDGDALRSCEIAEDLGNLAVAARVVEQDLLARGSIRGVPQRDRGAVEIPDDAWVLVRQLALFLFAEAGEVPLDCLWSGGERIGQSTGIGTPHLGADRRVRVGGAGSGEQCRRRREERDRERRCQAGQASHGNERSGYARMGHRAGDHIWLCVCSPRA